MKLKKGKHQGSSAGDYITVDDRFMITKFTSFHPSPRKMEGTSTNWWMIRSVDPDHRSFDLKTGLQGTRFKTRREALSRLDDALALESTQNLAKLRFKD